MVNTLRIIYYGIFIKFIVKVILGLNIKNIDNFPKSGPAVIIANHNSHLDTMIIMSLIPFKLLLKTYPVASMDYFMKNSLISWLSLNIIGIIPISIKKSKDHPFKKVFEKISSDSIIIYFPEGSRGVPEDISKFKSGISKIAQKFPNVPIVPIAINGAGTALPRGNFLMVPLICDVVIGNNIYWHGNKDSFTNTLHTTISTLKQDGSFKKWV